MTKPSIAVVIPMMDRAAELNVTLPTILAQDYPAFDVYVVDCGSLDDLEGVLSRFDDPRLHHVRLPRPDFFSFSHSRNAGARYSRGDLMLFLDGDCRLIRSHTLSAAVEALQQGPVEHDWFASWRDSCGYERLEAKAASLPHELRSTCGHGLSSVLLVERQPFEAIGGYNELLEGWGYEDTEIVGRLELCGFGRVPISGFENIHQGNEELLRRRNHRNKDIRSTWAHNRLLSDSIIKRAGPIFAARRFPGLAGPNEPDGSPNHTEREWDCEAIQLSQDVIAQVRRSASAFSGLAGGASMMSADRELPLVSVVVPCKNSAGSLGDTLESILSQSYPNIECIVVDAASTDGTIEVLERYGDSIRWISRPDRGAFDAINEGWSLSRGQVLTWLNADDVWEPDSASIAVQHFLEHPEADVVYGHCGGIDETGRLIDFFPARPWSLTEAVLNCDHIINQAAAFMTRRILEKVDWLYPAWCHDHDLWLRIALAGGTFLMVDAQLASARIWAGNLGNSAQIVIPGKIGLTERFFARADLTEEVAALRRTAMSNAHLCCLSYIRMDNWSNRRAAISLLWHGLRWDPGNTLRKMPFYVRGATRRLGTGLMRPRLMRQRRRNTMTTG